MAGNVSATNSVALEKSHIAVIKVAGRSYQDFEKRIAVEIPNCIGDQEILD